MPFTAPSEELTQSSQGFTAPDDEIQQPTPRFQIQPTPPDSSTAPIPRGLTKAQLQQRQQDARVDAIPAQLAEGALNVAEPITEGLTPSALLNTPNRLVKMVAPNSPAAQDSFQPNTPVINVPSPTGTGVAAGLGRLGAGLLSGLTTPESIVTLPAAAQSAVMRALFAGHMVKDLPQEAQDAYKTLQDPNATTADKIVAVGNPVIQSAMVGALSFLHPKAPASGLKSADIPAEPKLPNENQPNSIAPPENPPVVAAPPAAPDATSPVAETPPPADNSGNAVPDTNAKPVLQPALRDGDKILTGGGNKHDEIILAHSNEMSPDDQVDFLTRNGDDKVERGFVDQNNNFLTKPEAEKTGVFDGKAPNSENLPDYDPNAAPPPLKVSAIKAASDFDRYQELTSSLKGKTMDEVQPILKEIETIKNRNGGNPPVEKLAPPAESQPAEPIASLQPATSALRDSGSDVPLPEGTPTPAHPNAEGVPSTRGEDVLKAAVEKGLIEKTGDLPTHEGLNIKREASKAVDFINANPDEALKISKGEENTSGVRPEAVYTALEEKAIQGGDVSTLRELANSSLPTEAGQRLKLLDSNSPFSPVKIMRDIRNAREAAAERRTKTTKEKVVKEIKQSIKRNYSRLDSWEDVVRKLACN